MTEMSPLGTVTNFNAAEKALPQNKRQALIAKAGKACYGCDMKLIDDNGNPVPMDGKTAGNLCVKGFCVAKAYYKDDRKEAFLPGGWFATGDVASITPDGWLTITDRSKDVIKSGG
mmetsp:Transcript_4521/g.699  ORF Transcript_4521/g.699 Transcript_4521/m.699 type:complete len:116 (-) Transcript_4521:409-756(-)